MISVADGWQHGPQVDKGARWEPAEVGAAVRELLAKAPAARAGVRRAVTANVRTRRRPRCRRAGARRRRGPTRRCSTGSRAPTATHARDRRRRRAAHVDDLRARSARVAAAAARARRRSRATSSCWQLPNWWEAVVFCWAVWRCGAIASPITPTLRAREVGFILDQTDATRRSSSRERSAAPTTRRSLARGRLRRRRARGPRRRPLPRRRAGRPTLDGRASTIAARHPLDVGHDRRIRRASCTRTRSLRVEADTIAAAHDMRAGRVAAAADAGHARRRAHLRRAAAR